MWCVTFPACPPCSLAMQSQYEDISTAYYYKTMSYRLTPAQRDVLSYYQMIKEQIRATQVGSTWTRQPTPTSFLFAHFAMEDARKNVLELFGIRYHEQSFSKKVQTKFIGEDSIRLTYPPQTVRLCLLLTVGASHGWSRWSCQGNARRTLRKPCGHWQDKEPVFQVCQTEEHRPCNVCNTAVQICQEVLEQ